MELIDFEAFAPFQCLRKKMNAKRAGRFELFDEKNHLTMHEKESLVCGGLEVPPRRLRILNDQTLAYKNSRVLVVIINGEDEIAGETEFHLANCEQISLCCRDPNSVHTDIFLFNDAAVFDVATLRSIVLKRALQRGDDIKPCSKCLQRVSYGGVDTQRLRRRGRHRNIYPQFSIADYFNSVKKYPLTEEDFREEFIF